MNFLDITPEERLERLELARLTKLAKKEQREANKHLLKLDYLDKAHWATLATKYKIRMPNEAEPTTVSIIRKYLKRANVPVDEWNAQYSTAKEFVENNPRWSGYAVAGLILEMKEALEA